MWAFHTLFCLPSPSLFSLSFKCQLSCLRSSIAWVLEIERKRISLICAWIVVLLHAYYGWYCYVFATLLYLFKHIWTNLLTQCTQCQFLSTDLCELQVFTHIYNEPKIPKKYIKNQTEASRVPKEGQRGTTPLLGGHPPSRAKRVLRGGDTP